MGTGQQGTRATRAEGAGHRRVRTRRDVRRADRQGVRSGRHWSLQHDEVDMVRSIGADDVIDYTLDDITGGGQRFDVILDTGGNRSLTHLRPRPHPTGGAGHRRRRNGRTVARRHRPSAPGAHAVPVRRPAAGHAHDVGERGGPDRSHRAHRVRQGDTGHRPDVPAERDPAAIRYMEEGHARGKVVVTV